MATNPYFNSKGYAGERLLALDLTEETISMAGFNMYYIPRITSTGFDKLLGEDRNATFAAAIPLEFYLEDHSAATGDGAILSKFGLEVRDSYKLSVSPRRFTEAVVSSGVLGIPDRPREGDLIFLDLEIDSNPNVILMEIKYLENESPHYQLGQSSIYQLECEMFRYNNETFSTGIDVIDNYFQNIGVDSTGWRLLTESDFNFQLENMAGYISAEVQVHNEVMPDRKYADNDFLQAEAIGVVEDFADINPFSGF